MSIGALTALTAAEYARTREAASARFGRVKVEPLSLYGVLRGQQEFGAHQSTAGLMLTAVHRDMEEGEGPRLRDPLWRLPLIDFTYHLHRVTGRKGAVDAVLAAHYVDLAQDHDHGVNEDVPPIHCIASWKYFASHTVG